MTTQLSAHPDSGLDRQIEEALSANPYVARSDVWVEHDGGHVTLRGTVRSFFHKQMAQETVRRIDGVSRIDNCLEVVHRTV